MNKAVTALLVTVCLAGPAAAQEIFSDGFENGVLTEWSSFVGWGGRECDVFIQDCTSGEGCYLNLGSPGYPTVCAPATPEPVMPGGCVAVPGTEPQGQGECCSYLNTCDVGLGCLQLNTMGTGLVCASYCDPTGQVGPDNCFADYGPAYYCLGINRFYSNVDDLEDYFGFCTDSADWGPPECWNGIQDPDEDGIDCCDPGNPACLCVFECL